jgi:hypothetical protein
VDFETMGEEVLGDELEGWATVGAAPRRAAPPRMLRVPPKPAWRAAVAPGVPMPGQGMELLPLTNPAGAPTFTAALAAFNMEARPQRPFRAERLLVTVRRNGASAAGLIVVCTGIFIGTQLQQLELGTFDIEFFGPTAFGVRLDLISATPGMLVRLPIQLQGGVLAGADTIAVSMVFLGRSIR